VHEPETQGDVPYSKWYLVSFPLGSISALKTAEEVVTPEKLVAIIAGGAALALPVVMATKPKAAATARLAP
jgi:hypothetical protein